MLGCPRIYSTAFDDPWLESEQIIWCDCKHNKTVQDYEEKHLDPQYLFHWTKLNSGYDCGNE